MYSNLSLYYLGQMEIIPWIQKASDDSLVTLEYQFIVDTELNNLETKLFKRILNWLGIHKNYQLMTLSKINKNIAPGRNIIDLCSAENNAETFVKEDKSFNYIKSISIQKMILFPVLKKQFLKDLTSLKNQICQ